VRFTEVELMSNTSRGANVMSFYLENLQFPATAEGAIHVGESRILFSEVKNEPFYHFAFLLPGDRFTAALQWLRSKTSLLPDRETGSEIFDFDNWSALACYFLDPAGNIVEFIAHRGLEENSRHGPFTPSEVVGVSELGLVCPDTAATAKALEDNFGLLVWDGTVEDPQRLAFIGEPGRTLILSPPSRPWLPTDRLAELHPTRVVLDGVLAGEARIPETPHVLVGHGHR
jgi:hypothetical protein